MLDAAFYLLTITVLILLATIGILFKKVVQYRQESLTDHLTQLPNRRFFEQELKREFSESQRYNHSLSLITVDLDYFKNYNDKNGHPAGDRVLRQFADLLQKEIRQSDSAARTGGEEFSIICPQTDIAGTKLLAERICVETPTKLEEITVSLGIASFPKDAKEEKGLIEKSDQALYKAKEKRNCVVAYGETPAA